MPSYGLMRRVCWKKCEAGGARVRSQALLAAVIHCLLLPPSAEHHTSFAARERYSQQAAVEVACELAASDASVRARHC